MELEQDFSYVKLLFSNITSVKPKEPKKEIKCEELKTFNRFSVLTNEEVHVEDNNPAGFCEIISNKFKKDSKIKETRNKKRSKEKEQLFDIKQKRDEPETSEDKFPILRCHNCWKTHFPSRKICQRLISGEFENEYPVEASSKPTVLDSDFLNILLYCIEYLELKSLIDTKCTCQKNQAVLPSQDNYGSERILLKGGYGDNPRTSSLLVGRAIESAKKHGINIVEGMLNKADGNCAFDAVINNINHRQCFLEKLSLSSLTYRQIWITELESETSKYPRLGAGFSKEEIVENWNQLKQSGVYEVEFFGDLVIHAIARGCRKNILIFDTSIEASDPIYVIRAEEFGGYVDSDIPIVIGYNQVHYESLHPASEDDIQKTIELINSYISGSYEFKKSDISFLINSASEEDESWPK